MRTRAPGLILALLAVLLGTGACYYPVDQYGGSGSRPQDFSPPPPPGPSYGQAPSYPPGDFSPPLPPPPPVFLGRDPVEAWLLPDFGVYILPEVSIDLFFYQDRWYRRSGYDWYFSFDLGGPWGWIGHKEVPYQVTRIPIPNDYRKNPPRHERIPFGFWKSKGYRWDDSMRPPPLARDPAEVWWFPEFHVVVIADEVKDILFAAGRWYRRWGEDWFYAFDLRGSWEWMRDGEVPREVEMFPTDWRREPPRYRYERGSFDQWKRMGFPIPPVALPPRPGPGPIPDPPPRPAPPPIKPPYEEGRLIVKFRDQVSPQGRDRVLAQERATVDKTLGGGALLLLLPRDMTVDEGIDRFRSHPEIEYAEANRGVQPPRPLPERAPEPARPPPVTRPAEPLRPAPVPVAPPVQARATPAPAPAPPAVGEREPSEVLLIRGTKVFLVPAASGEVFHFDRSWYSRVKREWFRGRGYAGPWEPVPQNRVPEELRNLPDDLGRAKTLAIPFRDWVRKGYQWEDGDEKGKGKASRGAE